MNHKLTKRLELEFEPRAISYLCSSILHLWAQKTENGLKQKSAFQNCIFLSTQLGLNLNMLYMCIYVLKIHCASIRYSMNTLLRLLLSHAFPKITPITKIE